MYANLNTVAVLNERLNSSHKNGAIKSATDFSCGVGKTSKAQLLSGNFRMAATTSSTVTHRNSLIVAALGAVVNLGGGLFAVVA